MYVLRVKNILTRPLEDRLEWQMWKGDLLEPENIRKELFLIAVKCIFEFHSVTQASTWNAVLQTEMPFRFPGSSSVFLFYIGVTVIL